MMYKFTSSSSLRANPSNSDNTSGVTVPSYMRTTTASQSKTSCTPRSKSQEDFRRTPSVKSNGSINSHRERQASTPVSKSGSQPSCNISGISSIGSTSKPITIASSRPGALRMVAYPTGEPSKVRRNIMGTAGIDAKCPTKSMPLKVPHKSTSIQPTSFDEDMAAESKKAAVLQAMFLRNQAKKALETVETKAYCDRSFLSRCTMQLIEDIEKVKEEKKEMDTLAKLVPCLKMASESFDHLNSSLEAILKVLVSIDDDMNRRCSLVVLKGTPEVLNESTKKAIQGN